MSIPQQNLAQMVESEHRLALDARQRYGRYYEHAIEASLLLSNFVKAIEPRMEVFAMWMSQAKKHHLLAILSVVRLHHIQGMLDLRYAIEAATSAAYALTNPLILDEPESAGESMASA